LVVFWFVISRFSVTHELRIWDIMALRFGVGALMLAPTILRRGARLPATAWWEGLLFCLLWGLPFVLLVAVGLQRTSAAEAASIAPAAMPVFAGIMGWVVLGERQEKARWLETSCPFPDWIIEVKEARPGRCPGPAKGTALGTGSTGLRGRPSCFRRVIWVAAVRGDPSRHEQ
jgi:hypothetical protein